MGVKNCPETPRQKMINMMYLVLTALLALNVAAETLTAFKVVNVSLLKTFNSYTKKNVSVMDDFDWQMKNGQNRQLAAIYNEKATEIHNSTQDIVSFITDIKTKLALQVKAKKLLPGQEVPEEFPYVVTADNDTLILERQDDLNASPLIMIERGKGEELRNKILEFKKQMIFTIQNDSILKNKYGSSFFDNFEKILDVSNPEKRDKTTDAKTWVQQNFDRTPVIASITMLSKLQNDVRFAEGLELNALYSALSGESSFEAKVIPKSNYIISGTQDYQAEIFLSAVTNVPEASVYIQGSSTPIPLEGGKAVYKVSTQKPGKYTYKGEIRYMYKGNSAIAPFEGEYEVAQPTATISPAKMNVLYRGIKNPIEISVPGISSRDITAKTNNGSLIKENDTLYAMPSELKNTVIDVYATIGGNETKMGFKIFRVNDVPPPKLSLEKITTGDLPLAYLKTINKVSAIQENFLFDLEFEVTGFNISVATGGGMTATQGADSEMFTKEQRNLLNNLKKGDRLIFESARAKIRGSKTVKDIPLDPAIFTIK